MPPYWTLITNLPKVRTNYAKFNIRFSGAKLWNAIKEDLKFALKSF